MLWHKTWRETRTRFLISVLVVVVFCLGIVLAQGPIRGHAPVLPGFRSEGSYSQYIYNYVYSGMLKAVFIWILLFLGLGGLLREQAHGTAGFTLALPVGRVRLVVIRMATGLAQLAAIALLPALIIPAVSAAVHQSYPMAQALHFSVLWMICGAVVYAMTFLFSTVLGGEYTALAVSFVALFVQDLVFSSERLLPYRLKLAWIMGEFGTMHWDPQHAVFSSGPLPWTRLIIFSLAAGGMLLASLRIAQKQDF